MASLNKVQLIGNLGRDPEMRYSTNGQAQTKVSVATSRSYKKNEEWVEETEWHNIVIWGEKGERFAEQLRKGSKVYLEGSLKTTNWDDKTHEGVKHYKTEVVVDRFINLSGKGDLNEGSFEAPSGGFGGGSAPRSTSARPGDLDDLPF